VRSITYRNCWSIFLFEKEREYVLLGGCSLFYVYMYAVTIRSISFFFYLLAGHHHHHLNSRVVVAILSSYSYSSGNQLRVVGAIFPPMFSFDLLFSIAFWFYYLPWIKEKRTPRSGSTQTSMRLMVNRISISNVPSCMCAVKVINTHMRDVEGNRFFFITTCYCQLDRQMDEQPERRSMREKEVKDRSHRAWACVDLTWGHHSSHIIQNDDNMYMYVCTGTLAPPTPFSSVSLNWYHIHLYETKQRSSPERWRLGIKLSKNEMIVLIKTKQP
jgi:hypothetical protein